MSPSAAEKMFANASLPDSQVHVDFYSCFVVSPAKYVLSSFNLVHVLVLLPLCIYILCWGFCKPKPSSRRASSASTMCHSDSFTYHLVSMELVGVVGCAITFSGNLIGNKKVVYNGMNIFLFTWYGQKFFHILTCGERYLAVVHPITYLSLKNERGVRIRNIITACTWLLCFSGFSALLMGKHIYFDVSLLIFSTLIISFCSLSVLWVLIRPGPGEHGDGRSRGDQSKQRAFYTIVVILGLLMMRLCFGLVWAAFDLSWNHDQCLIMVCGVWINLPSSLVLPLLYLQRAERLKCCKK